MRRVQKPAIRRSEARRLGARIAIQDEDLMPSERRFRDDSTKATRFHKPDDGDDRMNENHDDVEHAGIVSNLKNSQNSGRFCNSPPTRRLLRDFMNSPGTTQELAGTCSTLVCTYTSPDARWSSCAYEHYSTIDMIETDMI
jgi:hypothetical protein